MQYIQHWWKITAWLTVACIMSPGPVPVQAADVDNGRILIKANRIYTPDGLWGEPGEILVIDGKIKFVGAQVELALPAKTIEVDAIMPGLVNAYSSAGLNSGDTEFSREVTPEFDTLSTVDFRDRAFKEALDEGVTTVQIIPGTDNVFAGLGCVVKTVDVALEERLLSRANSLVLSICSDPASRNRSRTRPDSIYVRQPTNRMGVVWIVRSTLHRLGQGQSVLDLDESGAQVLGRFLNGELPAVSISRTDFDIRSALDIGDEFGFQPVIYGGDEVYRIIDEFKERKGRVVYTAMTTTANSLRGREGTNRRLNVPGKLAEHEVEFCLAGDNLLDQARFAVRFGLDARLALAAVTSFPAQMIGLSERVGSIAVNRDADLIAFSGDPLQPSSAIQWTMVNGKIYGDGKSQ
jgi:imidazolonepropionase-like amidohydrolase